ncbi:hypothetical protein [Microbacterium oxydans]|uniref:hypothetical protein n=1 Tax=Microbacterium oxydans TaxID=82380 RepID=UPI0011247FE6|nr:hypothetical protein [Microbacterium oxydans]
MSRDRKQRVENGLESAVVAAISAAQPVAGIAAAGFLAAGGSAHIKKWFRITDETFEDAGRPLDPDDSQLSAAYWILANGAAQTSRSAKWEYLAIALVNSGSWSSNPDFIVEHFAYLASRYSPEHVQMLGLLQEVEQHPSQVNATLAETRDWLFREIRDRGGVAEDLDLVLDVVLEDLIRDGLVSSSLVEAFTQGLSGEPSGDSKYKVTSTGLRFHRHVTNYSLD